MDYIISNLLVSAPGGLWEKIIMAFEGGIGSFAVSVILLTLIIKLLMSPVDFFNKRSNKNMAETQKRIQPQIEAINKKYAKDNNLRNQKLGELYKREKVNPMGSCFVMLINIALTFTIFLTLFNGMNAMASYKIASQYEQLQIAYVQEYAGDRLDLNQEKSVYEICLPFIKEIQTADQSVKDNANQNVAEVYNETKEGFLWIKNIWLADSPFKNSIPSFSEYATVARLTNEERENEEYKQVYEQIMTPLKDTQGKTNGYFVLMVICGGVTFLNQWLMTRSQKVAAGTKAKWGSMIFMTVFMAFFTLFYTTMFSLYMITSQIVSLALIPLTNLVNDAIDKKRDQKKIPTDRLKRI